MKLGTKSILFGAHCFFLHPFFVAAAWWKLFGFPFDPRLWVLFFVHDLGYWGKPNMDGQEGELHPYFGAKIMKIFGQKWYDLALYHSRFLAKKNKAHFSKLCVADKLAIVYTPHWLYLPMVRATGEINEYMAMSAARHEGARYNRMQIPTKSQKDWYIKLQDYMRKWVHEHKDMKIDNWTPEYKTTDNKEGVWL